jgi:SAM-dependent methyltransferase
VPGANARPGEKWQPYLKMATQVKHYYNTYKDHAEALYRDIRRETYGEDIGQNSWLTAGEYRHWFVELQLGPGEQVLEIASGSGGPAAFLVDQTGCTLTGVDINENGIAHANRLALEHAPDGRLQFLHADAGRPLPLADEAFDLVVCIDSINHLPNRASVLKEFRRVLRPGGRLLYTDPVVVTGPVTNAELATRSSIGFFLFLPPGENERLLRGAGFRQIAVRDVTENMAMVSLKWHYAREKRQHALLEFESEKDFRALQAFFKVVHILSSERRLSRMLYTAVK